MKCSHALSFCTSFAVVAVAQQYADHANTAITTLQNAYNGESGLWKGAATDLWWQSGNIVEMLARFGQADGTFKQTAADIIADTYAKSPNRQGAHDWKNDYYDDMGWWALGWIAAYDLTGNQQYLKTAEDIFTDMSGGWSTSCKAGGIWWDVPKKSISSISNELFLSTAAHLANRVGDKKKDYVNWARMEWDWFWGMGIIDNDSLAHDGLDKSTCQPNGDTIFTYNQGPILSGLSELAKATSDGGFIAHAKKIASGALSKLTENGILTERVDHAMDEQSGMFKGAFIRGLASLHSNEPEQAYADFFKKNADSVWNNAKNDAGLFKDRWQVTTKWTPAANTASHASGIDVLVAAASA